MNVAETIRDLVASGMPREEAVQQARAELAQQAEAKRKSAHRQEYTFGSRARRR